MPPKKTRLHPTTRNRLHRTTSRRSEPPKTVKIRGVKFQVVEWDLFHHTVKLEGPNGKILIAHVKIGHVVPGKRRKH